MTAVNLLDFDLDGLAPSASGSARSAFARTQLFRWIHQKGVSRLRRDVRPGASRCATSWPAWPTVQPPAVAQRAGLGRRHHQVAVRRRRRQCGRDGVHPRGRPRHAVRVVAGRLRGRLPLLLHRPPGLQPQPEHGRDRRPSSGLPSTGCASGCSCPTGERAITNVVMMGMGEPLQNYAALVPALRVMLDDHGYGLSRRRVTVSTSGVVPMIDRLRDDCPVALAVSLHAPNDALRDELVPLNRKYPLAELLAGLPRYLDDGAARLHHLRVLHARRRERQPDAGARSCWQLVRERRRRRGVPCKFNLIPFNPFPASGLQRSPRERVLAFAQVLQRRRHRDHRAQDPRRRHRRRLRPAGRRGAGPHAGARAPARARPIPIRAVPPAAATPSPPSRRSADELATVGTRAGGAARAAPLLAACTTPTSAPPPPGETQGPRHRVRPDRCRAPRAACGSSWRAPISAAASSTTALDEVKQAIAAEPEHGRGLQPARPDLCRPGRRSRWPRTASGARCSSTRATATRCTTTAGSCASSKRYAEADAQFEQALAQPQYRDVARTLLAQGVCQARAGQLAEAERTLSRAYELDPTQPGHGLQPDRGAVPPRRIRARALLHPPRQRSRRAVQRADAVAGGAHRVQAGQRRRGAASSGDQLRKPLPAVARGARRSSRGRFDE